MGAALTEVPQDFRFVLRRYDRAPEIPMIFASYAETTYSRNIEFEGRRAPTIFLKTIPARDRATKLGWIDETDSFNDFVVSSSPVTDSDELITEIVEPKVKTVRKKRSKKA